MKSLLKGTLPILAAAFGRQFGVNVRIGGSRAYTDGQSIQLPLIEDPKLRDGVLAYLVHESAHIRFTDFSIKQESAIQHSLRNTFEDVRIEKGMYEEEYPGTFGILKSLSDSVLGKDIGEEYSAPENPAGLLHDLILYKSRRAQYGTENLNNTFDLVQKAAEESFPAGFFIKLDVLFDRHFESMASTLDAHNFANAVLAAFKEAEEEEKQNQEANQEQPEDQNQQNQDSSSDSNSDSGSSGQGDDDSNGSEGAGQSSQNDQGSSDANDQNNTGEGNSSSGSNAQSDSSDKTGKSDTDSGPGGNGKKSLTEQIMSDKDMPEDVMDTVSKMLSEAAAEDIQANDNQNVRLDSSVGAEVGNNTFGQKSDGNSDHLKDGLLISSRLRQQVVGLLQSQSRARNSHREYGNRLDSKRMARAVSGERRIWKHKDQKKMVDTSVHILLDCSGSMNSRQQVANNATLSLAMAISQIPKADVAVSIFPGIDNAVSPLIKRKVPVRPKIDSFAVTSHGGTPMGEAMFYAAQELSGVSNKHRKVMIVITDGGPNNGDNVRYINRLIEKEIDVYAIGIGTEAVKQYFANSQVISKVEDLQTALFDLAGQFLKVA